MTSHRPSALVSACRRLAAIVAAWRRRARARADLASLDDRTLRDLGLDRSELSSILAETSGLSEATRQRIAPRPPAAPPAWHARSKTCPAGPRWASAAASLLAALVLGGCGDSTSTAFVPPVAERPAPTSAREDHGADPVYLPGRFPPPSGEVEPLPPQF